MTTQHLSPLTMLLSRHTRRHGRCALVSIRIREERYGTAQVHHRTRHSKGRHLRARAASDIQWLESYVADDKTFCVYLAKDEDIIRKHAEISGFPATKITEVRKTIGPTTERSD